jgi:hypothetical protein
MRTRPWLASALAAMVSFAAVAVAKDDPPLVPARLTLEPKTRFAVVDEETVESRVNGKDYTARTTLDLVLAVEAVDADGSLQMSLACKRVRAKYEMGGFVKEVDTAEADPWKGTSAGQYGGTQDLLEMTRRTALFTVSPRGVVTKVATPLHSDAVDRSAKQMETDRVAPLQRYFQPLPEKPVAKGGKWTAERPFAPQTVLDQFFAYAVVTETCQYKEPDGRRPVVICTAKSVKPTREMKPKREKSDKDKNKKDGPTMKEAAGEAPLYVSGATVDPVTGMASELQVETELIIHYLWSEGSRTENRFTQKVRVVLTKLAD